MPSGEGVAGAVQATVGFFGRLDAAVNNAGAVTLDRAWDATAADWRRQLDVNVPNVHHGSERG